ncbi:MAG TPA: sulfurtransferase TusA family protein [Cellulomonas sp.]
MTAGLPGDPFVVDARGLICPAPVIALAKAARSLPEGSRVTVLATDPAAAVDVPAWARMRGHQVLETKEDGEQLVLTVLLGPARAVPRPDAKVS